MKGKKYYLNDMRKHHRKGGYTFPDWSDRPNELLELWCWLFELWCWKWLLRVLWTARKSNQSILKEISPELEGLMLKLKLQYFGCLMQRTDSLEQTLMLRKIEGRGRRGRQRMRWLDGITDSMDMMSVSQALGVGDGQGSLVCCSSWGRRESDTTEKLNWMSYSLTKWEWKLERHTATFQLVYGEREGHLVDLSMWTFKTKERDKCNNSKVKIKA